MAIHSMVQDGYLSVLGAKTRGELESVLLRCTRQLEFETFSAMTVVDRLQGEPEFTNIDNTPAGYCDTFLEPHGGKKDPVMQHCKTRSVPIAWDQSTYVRAERAELWEHQAQHGYRCGVTVAMHLPAGRHFVLGLDRRQDLPKDPRKVDAILAELLMFAVHAHEATTRIVALESPAVPDASLTRRELETLRWTLDGKTAWEIGRILSIAEDTVARHAYNATQKLGCANKHHAAVKALRLGMIQ